MAKEKDIAEIMGEDPQEEAEDFAPSEEELSDYSDYFDDGMAIGSEESEAQAEAAKLEGRFLTNKDFEDGNIVVVPLCHRFLPEHWSREVLSELRKTDLDAFIKTMVRLKSDVLTTVDLHTVRFIKSEIAAFNKATGEDVRNLYDQPAFMTWNSQNDDDPIHWLAHRDKSPDWFKENVENEARRPINSFQGNITPSRVKTIQQVTIPVIDGLGALRLIQVKLNSKTTYEKAFTWQSFSDGAMEKDTTTEWIGRAVMVSKNGSNFTFQLLQDNSRLSEEQAARLEQSQYASEQGFDHTNLMAFGESKKSKARDLVLDFMGLREAWENR